MRRVAYYSGISIESDIAMAPEPTEQLKLDFALAAWGGEIRTLRGILSSYPDAVSWTDVGGGTVLRKAVAHGSAHLEAVKLLLEYGSHINAQDADGLTPLMYAAMHDKKECLKLFLEKDADTDLTDNRGRTAAQIAYELGHHETAFAIAAYVQNKRDTAERERTEALNAEAAQAHSGLDHAVAIKKPLVMRQRFGF
ncbi:MAG: ankyrin repeat domain-containing protein [Alphaproteobacteria bacterium]|nr:MAG: ankyrin repeat domain-containing protein [Alphaproteobacteria bacterium]